MEDLGVDPHLLGNLAHFDYRGQGSLEHYLHICALNKIRNKADYFAAVKRAKDVALTAGYSEARKVNPIEQSEI